MAKKSFGKFLALATLSGAVAAGVSYFLKYKSFKKELDKDFHDFEGDDDEDFDGSLPHESCTPERTYVTLGEKKADSAEAVEESPQAPAPKAEEAADADAGEVKKAAESVAENTDTTIIEEDSSIQ